MSKAMTIAGLIVSGLIAFVFFADLVLGFPFGGTTDRPYAYLMDIGSLVAAGMLGYLSWSAMREIR